MVGFAVGGGGLAAGEGAAEVAGEEEFVLGGGEEALGAACVDDGLALAVAEAGDVGVAEGGAEQG